MLKHTTALLIPFPTRDTHFEKGPFITTFKGYSDLMTCIDLGQWPPSIFPNVNITAETVAEEFVTSWVTHFFGVPLQIGPQGSQLESSLMASFLVLECALRASLRAKKEGLGMRLHTYTQLHARVSHASIMSAYKHA